MSSPGKQQLQKKLARNVILMGRTLAPDAFKLDTPDFHYDVAATLQDTSLKKLCLQWPRDHAKCLCGTSTVIRADGSRTQIRAIEKGDRVMSYNQETGNTEPDTVVGKVCSGEKECLEVTTRSGRSLTMTPDHRVLSFSGWTEAENLSEGGRLASPRHLRTENLEKERKDEEVRFLAYMLAEGSFVSGNRSFSNGNSRLILEAARCAGALGFGFSDYGSGCFGLSDGITEWAKENGLLGRSATEKRVPSWVFSLPNRQKWLFLGSFIDTDGYVAQESKKIGISLANRELVRDLASLFSQVGVVTTLHSRENGYAGSWTLQVDAESVGRVAEKMPLVVKGDAVKSVARRVEHSRVDMYPNEVKYHPDHSLRSMERAAGVRLRHNHDLRRTTVRKLNKEIGYERWTELEESDVFWDQITDIEYVGTRETYDVQIQKNQNLVTEGIVTHNSTLGAELLPIWHLFFQHTFTRKRRQTRFVVLISKSQREAKRRLRTVKSIIADGSSPDGQSPFTDLLGDWGEDTARKWTDEEVVLKDGSTIISTGWSQQGRGLKAKHQRPSLIVVDDPEDEQNTKTDAAMENNLEWMLSAIEPATSVEGRCILIGTPIAQRSLVRVLHDMDDWTSIKYKAIYEEDGERKALWPSKWPVEELLEKRENMKAIGREALWYKEYQCQLVQGESSPITAGDFKYFDGRLETVDRGPISRHFLHVTHRGRTEADAPDSLPDEEVIPVTVTMGVDPASSTSARADYSTIVVVAWAANGDAYVLDYFRQRVSPLDHAERIMDFYKQYGPQRTRVESDGYQTMLREYLNDPRHFDERIPGLAAKETAGGQGESKVDRHLGLQFLFSKGHVHLKPYMTDFRDEWVLMEDAEHDDLRDGFWWAHRCKLEPTHDADLLDTTDTGYVAPTKDPMVA